MNLYYEKMIFGDFYGLKMWGSCLDVHLFVLEPFCIENNRKTRKKWLFLKTSSKIKALFFLPTKVNEAKAALDVTFSKISNKFLFNDINFFFA